MDWDGLRARVCAGTGWTWEYVGEHLTLPRLRALNKHWESNPPLQAQLAGLLGGLGGLPAPETREESGSLDDLMGCWTAAGGGMG